MSTPTRSRGQRAGLTLRDVLDAAGDVVRAEGHERLSMRAVAARLGVAPNALYSHVEGKAALVDALLDDRLSAVPDPDPAAPPREEVRDCMLATYDLLLADLALVPLYLARHGSRGPRASELGRALEVLLERAGVPATRRRIVVRVLVLTAIGLAAQATSAEGTIPAPELRATLAASVEWLVDGAATHQA